MLRFPLLSSALAGTTLALSACASSPTPAPAYAERVAQLEQPESAYYFAAQSAWFVSNIGGGANMDFGEKDADGFITKLDASGQVVALRFATGLDAPKGLRGHGDTLYVTDVTRVVALDAVTGALKRSIDVPGSAFLNDLEVDANGTVWVSDTPTNTLFRIPAGGTPEVWLRDAALEAPNGLLLDGNTLLVAGIGPGLNPNTFATEQPGRVLEVDLRTKAIRALSERLGALDGIERDGDQLWVSDFASKRLMRLPRAGGAATPLDVTFENMTADLGFDPGARMLGVPELNGQQLRFVKAPR